MSARRQNAKNQIQVRCVLTSCLCKSVDRAGGKFGLPSRSLRRAIARLRPSGLRRGSLRFAPQAKAGGVDRDRTDDLKLAKLALSQLSYDPVFRKWAWSANRLIRSWLACRAVAAGAIARLRRTGFGAAAFACFAAKAGGPGWS